MEFEGRARITSLLNMAPLIDVVLLLLIFFMLTSTYLVAEAIDLELPFSKSARPVSEQDVVVVLSLDGTVRVNDETIAREDLVAHLTELITNPEEQTITLKTQAEESVEDMIGVMDDIRTAGGQRVLIATQSDMPPGEE
jgi:biopolymer transport protein ExbD